jgi:hypothetical protein
LSREGGRRDREGKGRGAEAGRGVLYKGSMGMASEGVAEEQEGGSGTVAVE